MLLPCHRLRQGKKEVERERSREGREENNDFPFPTIARFAKNHKLRLSAVQFKVRMARPQLIE